MNHIDPKTIKRFLEQLCELRSATANSVADILARECSASDTVLAAMATRLIDRVVERILYEVDQLGTTGELKVLISSVNGEFCEIAGVVPLHQLYMGRVESSE